jgi:hypothetical protein
VPLPSEPFCHQGQEFRDGGSVGELVVGGGEEPFDDLGAVDAAEVVGEPGSGGAEGDLGVDAVGGPGGCGHDAF